MEINLAKNIGFCDGVKRAYDMVRDKFDGQEVSGQVFILGSLAHNDSVAARVNSWGIQQTKTLDVLRPNDTLIITAHGAARKVFDAAAERGAKVVDATCPKVTRVQQLAEQYSQDGYQVLIFGDPDHKEVKGVQGWCSGNVRVISDLEGAGRVVRDWGVDGDGNQKTSKPVNQSKHLLVSQTTQKAKLFKEIQAVLQKAAGETGQELKVFDTICRATSDRQSEVARMAAGNDFMIIVGGKESGNTKRLWQITKEKNPQTTWISKLDEETRKNIKRRNKDAGKTGIASGASTPEWEIKDLVNFLGN